MENPYKFYCRNKILIRILFNENQKIICHFINIINIKNLIV